REVIRKNYVLLLEELLGGGCYVGIAGHDEWVIWEAFRVIDQLGVDPSRYEFQMLHGVDPQLRRIILEAGHPLRVAVPFGPMWYPYSCRRLRKNPRIARYVLEAMFKRNR
ncbi:MAG: proline dehydrogenase family protein, partial [Acidobacteriota bacterium]